jgi:hypothetical protein
VPPRDAWGRPPGWDGTVRTSLCPALDRRAGAHHSRSETHKGGVIWIGLEQGAYRTHSISRTKAAPIYNVTAHLRAVQFSLGHTKMASNVLYLESRARNCTGIFDGVEM